MSHLYDTDVFSRCYVAGWGKNAFGNSGSYQTILKEVDVPVMTQPACQAALRGTRLGSNFVLDNSFLCAGGEPGKDACTVREYDTHIYVTSCFIGWTCDIIIPIVNL